MRRLRTRPQFQAVLAGATVARTAHFALHRCALDVGAAACGALPRAPLFPPSVDVQPWIGVLLPKRWARRAVTRNAIRRQIYQVAQHAEPGLPAAAHVVRLRAGFDRARFPSASSDALKRTVRGELVQLFARAAQPATGQPPRAGRAPASPGGQPSTRGPRSKAEGLAAAPPAAASIAPAASLPTSSTSPGCSVS